MAHAALDLPERRAIEDMLNAKVAGGVVGAICTVQTDRLWPASSRLTVFRTCCVNLAVGQRTAERVVVFEEVHSRAIAPSPLPRARMRSPSP